MSDNTSLKSGGKSGNKNIVITIARQYGSGGRTVGERLAKELGFGYYDRELLTLASEDSGINIALFERADEIFKPGLLFGQGKNVYAGELLGPDSDEYTSDDNLFNFQAKIIRQLAAERSCVIIGRCADFILKDMDNVLSVFVHAPKEFLMEQSAKKLSMSDRELEKYISKIDKYRSDYYKYHTGREWTDARNYDLCLNSGRLGFDRCVEEIKSYMKVRFDAEF